jgi:hypothetical protein
MTNLDDIILENIDYKKAAAELKPDGFFPSGPVEIRPVHFSSQPGKNPMKSDKFINSYNNLFVKAITRNDSVNSI